MPNQVSNFIVGNKVYELIDGVARKDSDQAKKYAEQVNNTINDIYRTVEQCEADMKVVVGATTKPDTTLTLSGYAADAKITGDLIRETNNQLRKEFEEEIDKITVDTDSIGAISISQIANNLTTTTSGYVLDARQGEELKSQIDSGVRNISSGTSNGSISVTKNGETSDVHVNGLGSAAYTDSTSYALATHSHDYISKTSFSLSGTTLYINVG